MSKIVVNGENMVYYILQKHNTVNPSIEDKYLIERMLLSGGVWFKPELFKMIPIFLPYVIRDASCRKKNPATGKDTRGEANDKGLMPDDNSSIKGIPSSLIIKSKFKEMNGATLTKGWVASHVWITLQTRTEHACEWEHTNSFIPNLVWLPAQLSKLTDRNGSYAQQFVQHISYLLYRKVTLSNPLLSGIWTELKDPGIKPICKFSLDDLNYFTPDVSWINRRVKSLFNELQSILNILNGVPPIVKTINCSKYVPTLMARSTTMARIDKQNLIDWINANMSHLSASLVSVPSKSSITKVSASRRTKKTIITRTTSSKTGGISLYTNKQIANSIKAYLFEGLSFRVIEYTHLGMPKRTNGGGWAAKNLLESRNLDSSMKMMFKGKTIAQAMAMSKEPLKTTLKWMDANL